VRQSRSLAGEYQSCLWDAVASVGKHRFRVCASYQGIASAMPKVHPVETGLAPSGEDAASRASTFWVAQRFSVCVRTRFCATERNKARKNTAPEGRPSLAPRSSPGLSGMTIQVPEGRPSSHAHSLGAGLAANRESAQRIKRKSGSDDCRRFRSQNCAAKRGRNPSLLVKPREFSIGPSAFGPDSEHHLT